MASVRGESHHGMLMLRTAATLSVSIVLLSGAAIGYASTSERPADCAANEVYDKGTCRLVIPLEEERTEDRPGETEKAQDGSTRPASQSGNAATAKPVCRDDGKVIPCCHFRAEPAAHCNPVAVRIVVGPVVG